MDLDSYMSPRFHKVIQKVAQNQVEIHYFRNNMMTFCIIQKYSQKSLKFMLILNEYIIINYKFHIYSLIILDYSFNKIFFIFFISDIYLLILFFNNKI